MCIETLTVKQVAEKLGKTTPYVYAEIKSGRLQALDMSPAESKRSTLRIRVSAMEEWLDSLTYVPAND